MSAADLELLQLAERARNALDHYCRALQQKLNAENREIEAEALARYRLAQQHAEQHDEPPSRPA